jgi:hypothetical protein
MKRFSSSNHDLALTMNYREECQCQVQAVYRPAGRERNEENIVLMADVLLTFHPFDDEYAISRVLPIQVLVSEIKLKHVTDHEKGLVVVMPKNITLEDNRLRDKIGSMLVEQYDVYFGRQSI